MKKLEAIEAENYIMVFKPSEGVMAEEFLLAFSEAKKIIQKLADESPIDETSSLYVYQALAADWLRDHS